jgi:hypothetical protein
MVDIIIYSLALAMVQLWLPPISLNLKKHGLTGAYLWQ